MTRSTDRPTLRLAPGTRAGRRTLGALVALAVVATAAAPAVIRIKPGDTLWDLARTHGTSVSTLKALNDLPGNGTIYAGDTLRLPGGASSGSSGGSGSGGGTHRVVRGDTLSEVAVRYGVSQRAIAERNGLSGSVIKIGQRLVIPTGGSPAVSASTGRSVSSGVQSSASRSRSTLSSRSVPSKATVRSMVAATARRHGVDPALAVAVAYHESGFQQRVVSPVNAIGVMQVLPSTGSSLSRQIGQSLDLYDTQDNITAGVLVLRQLLRITGSTDEALAGYYQGLGSIAKKGVLPQTRQYIKIIHIHRARFARG